MSLEGLQEAVTVHQSRIGNGDDRGSVSSSIGGDDASIALPLNNDLIVYRNPNSLNRLYTLMSTHRWLREITRMPSPLGVHLARKLPTSTSQIIVLKSTHVYAVF